METPFDDWLVEPTNDDFEPPSALDAIGYSKPENKYLREPMPKDFASYLLSQDAAPALLVWKGSPGVYICGGAIRNYHNKKEGLEDADIRDVDLYFRDATEFEKAYNTLLSLGLSEVARTERAVTMIQSDETKPAIQLVNFVFGTIGEVLNEFDYTIVRAGATSTEMVTCDTYNADLKARVLHYCGSRLPLASLSRAIKYARYGYKLPAKDMVAIVTDIRDKVDLDDPIDVQYHVTSFDPSSAERDAGEVVF